MLHFAHMFPQFGGHLKSLGQQLAAGGQQEARTRLGGIAGRWKALTAAKRSSTVTLRSCMVLGFEA
eukprot:822488-Pelagomonas_calceolata.AAC.1